MGIDVILSWDGQTDEERAKSLGAGDIVGGQFGYLREPYGNGIHKFTHALFPEKYWKLDWRDETEWGFGKLVDDPQELIANVKKARRVVAMTTPKAITRDVQDSVTAFVELVRQKHRAGLNPRIYISF